MLRAAGRQIAKRHKKAQRPHGRQSVKSSWPTAKNVNSIEVEAPKLFDRMARRFHVDYAFYKTGPDKYLLFFKAGQADAITACFERYSRRLLEQSKSSRIPIREQLKKRRNSSHKKSPKRKSGQRRWFVKNDKHQKYLIPNIPYLLFLWACLKLGTAYRLAAGADFAHKLMGLGQTIGPAFADFAPGLAPFDWLVGIVGAVAFRVMVYVKSKNAKNSGGMRSMDQPVGAVRKI